MSRSPVAGPVASTAGGSAAGRRAPDAVVPLRRLLPVVALALAVHAQSLGAGFVHDDRPQILGNPLLVGLDHLPALWTTPVWAGAGGSGSFYRPLMMTSFALDAALLGRTPPAMHAVQLLLYAALVWVAIRVAARLSGDAAAGLGSGLLLAVHPVCVEPAAWISARCEILAALFGLAALGLHGRRLATTDGAGPGLAAAEAGALFLALASKESAVVFVPALLALDWVRRAAWRPGAAAARWGPAALALGAMAGLRAQALGGVSAGLLASPDPGALLGAIGQGLSRLLLPVGLGIAPPPPGPVHVALGAVAVGVAGGLAVQGLRRRADWLVPLALLAAGVAVAAAGAARIGELADRYLLVPVLATGWLAGIAWRRLPARAGRPARVGAAALLALLALLSLRHGRVYQDDVRLWRGAVAQNPGSATAVTNLASALVERGRLEAAEPWLERAATLTPQDPLVRLNQAVLAAGRGDPGHARETLLTLVQEDPRYWQAQLRLGHLALDADDLPEAVRRYEAALAVHGLAAEAWAGLGVAHARAGRHVEARAALQRALRLDPQQENAAALRRVLSLLERTTP